MVLECATFSLARFIEWPIVGARPKLHTYLVQVGEGNDTSGLTTITTRWTTQETVNKQPSVAFRLLSTYTIHSSHHTQIVSPRSEKRSNMVEHERLLFY